jgi:hypothetical protein
VEGRPQNQAPNEDAQDQVPSGVINVLREPPVSILFAYLHPFSVTEAFHRRFQSD